MARISSDEIHGMAARLAERAATPEYLDMVRQIRAAPAAERGLVGHQAIDEIKQTGPLPDGFRMATRAFEPPPEAVATYDDGAGEGAVVYDGMVVTVAEGRRSTQPATDDAQAPEVVQSTIQRGIDEIGKLVLTPEFQALLDELYALPEDDRPAFVKDVILDPDQRARRGVVLPPDMFVQRSAFADRRPTLFCVSKVLPLAYPWHKVTITFDSR